MKNSFFACVSMALLLGAAGCSSKPDSVEQAQEANNANMGIKDADSKDAPVNSVSGPQHPTFDSDFLTKAASGGMLEVQLGQQVVQKATTPEAKNFAQQMITDHTKANEELKGLAAKKNIVLPTKLGEEQQQVYDEVLAEKGAELDKKYVQAMITDHGKDVKEYQEAVSKTSDPDVRAFAQHTLPTLQMHLGMVQKMQPVVENKK